MGQRISTKSSTPPPLTSVAAQIGTVWPAEEERNGTCNSSGRQVAPKRRLDSRPTLRPQLGFKVTVGQGVGATKPNWGNVKGNVLPTNLKSTRRTTLFSIYTGFGRRGSGLCGGHRYVAILHCCGCLYTGMVQGGGLGQEGTSPDLRNCIVELRRLRNWDVSGVVVLHPVPASRRT